MSSEMSNYKRSNVIEVEIPTLTQSQHSTHRAPLPPPPTAVPAAKLLQTSRALRYTEEGGSMFRRSTGTVYQTNPYHNLQHCFSIGGTRLIGEIWRSSVWVELDVSKIMINSVTQNSIWSTQNLSRSLSTNFYSMRGYNRIFTNRTILIYVTRVIKHVKTIKSLSS